jgi:hypothetical protein
MPCCSPFLEAPQRPLSREHLLQATRLHGDVFDRSIDVQILRLRRKLERERAARHPNRARPRIYVRRSGRAAGQHLLAVSFSPCAANRYPCGTSRRPYFDNYRMMELARTRALAAELGPRKIRVNAIAPGTVETEGTHSAGITGSDFEKAMIAGTPLGRFGQPDDIARIAVFLASDDSAWLTGERLTASGGYR